MQTGNLQFETANGATTAFVVLPETVNAETKAIILIHEWWGINENIKDIASRYAAQGFLAIAPDLYRGKVAANPTEAGALMNALPISDGVDTIKNAVVTARKTYGVSKFGISGFCMGGTFSLRAACELNDFSAACPFYGDIPPENVLQNLKTPVIFFAGTKDSWINPHKVETELREVAAKYNLPVEIVTYEADHAFFNNTRTEVFDETAAKDAWGKVIALLNDKL